MALTAVTAGEHADSSPSGARTASRAPTRFTAEDSASSPGRAIASRGLASAMIGRPLGRRRAGLARVRTLLATPCDDQGEMAAPPGAEPPPPAGPAIGPARSSPGPVREQRIV